MNELLSHLGKFSLQRAMRTVLGILVIVLFLFLLNRWWIKLGSVVPSSNEYQAVFLTNNQVYYGKLTIGRDTYILNDVFYLQTDEGAQRGNAQAPLKLLKLGHEIHAPKDPLYISKNHVLYWENLRNDGQLLNSIKTYKTQLAAGTLKK